MKNTEIVLLRVAQPFVLHFMCTIVANVFTSNNALNERNVLQFGAKLFYLCCKLRKFIALNPKGKVLQNQRFDFYNLKNAFSYVK